MKEMSCKSAKMAKGMKDGKKKKHHTMKHSKEALKEAAIHMHKHAR